MGSFDCYCALCGGPMGIYHIRFGSRNPEALMARRERVRKARARGGLVDADSDQEMKDSYSDAEEEELKDSSSDAEEDQMKDSSSDAKEEEEEEEKEEEEEEEEEKEYHENPFAKKEELSWGDDAESDSNYAQSSSTGYSSDSESIESARSDLPTGAIEDVPHPPPSPPSPDRRDPHCWSQWSDLTISDDEYEPYNKDHTDSWEEKQAYDPEILQPDDVRWIDRCRALAFNPRASGVTKAYISGRGRYSDYGIFNINRPGHDPNDPGEDHLSVYYTYPSSEDSAYPFHEECYKVLAKALGHKRYQDIDKDVLYGLMSTVLGQDGGEPILHYGPGEGREQVWMCQPGKEFVACDPRFRPEFTENLAELLPANLLRDFDFLSLSAKTRQDPFGVIPYEILLIIFEYSDDDSMLNLIRASTHVMETTRSTPFWKSMLRLRTAPWFWELAQLLDASITIPKVDLKGLFLWAHKVTEVKYGQEGPFMGISNRRRIYNTAQQLRPLYKERLTPIAYAAPPDEEAKSILDNAQSLDMRIVLFPQKSSQTISAQFIRSWHEVANRSYNFDAYWNAEGALIGIALSFGSDQRVFGSTNGNPGLAFHIEAQEWITEIEVYLGNCNMFDEWTDRRNYRAALDVRPHDEVHIEGLKVTLSSGRSKASYSSRNIRPFIVLPSMYLIGLTGQVASDGAISRLGLLQSFRPDCIPRNSISYQPAQTMLWAPSAKHIYNNLDNKSYPIWSHPYYKLHTFDLDHFESSRDIPRDVLPHNIILWADSASTLKHVTAIEALILVSGECISGTESWDIPDIIALRVKNDSMGRHTKDIGHGGPVPSMNYLEWHKGQSGGKKDDGIPINPSDLNLSKDFEYFDPRFVQSFAIDGANGEVVTEVYVSNDFKAIQLKTNKGRECYWGESRRNNWTVRAAAEDEVILGLSVCFGRMSGWSWSAKLYSHWKVSEVGVVIGRKDEGRW